MTIATWLLFCATETVLCFTPGPAVLLVVSLSLGRGTRSGFLGSLGILTANVGYFALSATSLGAALVASWQLFFALKWIGAAYLVWIGTRMALFPSRSPGPSPGVAHSGSAFWYGLVTQAANPKALLFFAALLPQFVDPSAQVPFQILVLGLSSVAIELAVLSVYVLATTRARGWVTSPHYAAGLERIGGLFLVAAGVRLAAIHRGSS